ncbi:OLC1v1037010C1 [Oldenlandia corymbosa var. corymbosa]|uniref:OLC1v1037010C1 n=1 Tax=Oldenlandia corymbosa var. corymbosa TaxID=529605 RepID=A0AAV1CXG1_OLDCO|nr:OLC1v1037010C1 [Oldenlandia corymbosa var. corymbosa]
MATVKMTRGRQKVNMVKMTNDSNLQVTFSKRRKGLFKKASELCTRTGSELAVVVFSPGSKVYSFGSPSVDQVLEKYETKAPHFIAPQGSTDEAHQANSSTNMVKLNEELSALEDHMDAMKKTSNKLAQMASANHNSYWWHAPIEELSVEQLEHLKLAYEELHRGVQIQAQKGLSLNVNLFPNFNIPVPSHPNNAFLGYESQPLLPPPNIHYPTMHSGSNFADGATFAANQGPPGYGDANLAFPFDDPNVQGPSGSRAAFPFDDPNAPGWWP